MVGHDGVDDDTEAVAPTTNRQAKWRRGSPDSSSCKLERWRLEAKDF